MDSISKAIYPKATIIFSVFLLALLACSPASAESLGHGGD